VFHAVNMANFFMDASVHLYQEIDGVLLVMADGFYKGF